MIRKMVGRCHVSDSYETVIRYVISKMVDGFKTYRELSTANKAFIVEVAIDVHNQNREQYNWVMGGLK